LGRNEALFWWSRYWYSLGSIFAAFLGLFCILVNIDSFQNIRCLRIWENLSWPHGWRAEIGLATEGSLIMGYHNGILSLVIDGCLSENWGFKISVSSSGFYLTYKWFCFIVSGH
jgi:hypothetical protein